MMKQRSSRGKRLAFVRGVWGEDGREVEVWQAAGLLGLQLLVIHDDDKHFITIRREHPMTASVMSNLAEMLGVQVRRQRLGRGPSNPCDSAFILC